MVTDSNILTVAWTVKAVTPSVTAISSTTGTSLLHHQYDSYIIGDSDINSDGNIMNVISTK